MNNKPIPELPKEHWPTKGAIEMQVTRGRDMLQRRYAGQTYLEIAAAHAVSKNRIPQILRQYWKRYRRADIELPPLPSASQFQRRANRLSAAAAGAG